MQKLCEEFVKSFCHCIKNDLTETQLDDVLKQIPESLRHCLSGYKVKEPASLLNPLELKQKNNDIIIVKGVKFSSFCEHHALPIIGSIDIGYIPRNTVTGIAGIKRLVSAITKRLQLQERICNQVCTSLQNTLLPIGVIVRTVAKHMCTMQEEDITMHTLHKTGIFAQDASQIEKFLTMLQI